MLSEFKNFVADRLNIEQLIALEAFGHSLREAYDRNGLEEPDFIGFQLKALKREIRARVADATEARRQQIKNQLEALKTPSEKKAALKKELEQIDKVLVDA